MRLSQNIIETCHSLKMLFSTNGAIATYTVNVLKFRTLKFLSKWHKQTVQTQIRLFLKEMGSSSHWGLIIVPGQEANRDNLGMSFRSSTRYWYDECTY